MFVTFIKSVKCFNVYCDESIRKNILFTSCLEKSLMCSLVATGAIKLPVFTYIKSCTTLPTFVIKIHHNFNPSFWSCLNHLIKSTPSKREVDAAIFWITSMGCGCTLLCGCSSQSTCCFRAKNPLRLLDEEDLKPFGFLSYLKKKIWKQFCFKNSNYLEDFVAGALETFAAYVIWHPFRKESTSVLYLVLGEVETWAARSVLGHQCQQTRHTVVWTGAVALSPDLMEAGIPQITCTVLPNNFLGFIWAQFGSQLFVLKLWNSSQRNV